MNSVAQHRKCWPPRWVLSSLRWVHDNTGAYVWRLLLLFVKREGDKEIRWVEMGASEREHGIRQKVSGSGACFCSIVLGSASPNQSRFDGEPMTSGQTADGSVSARGTHDSFSGFCWEAGGLAHLLNAMAVALPDRPSMHRRMHRKGPAAKRRRSAAGAPPSTRNCRKGPMPVRRRRKTPPLGTCSCLGHPLRKRCVVAPKEGPKGPAHDHALHPRRSLSATSVTLEQPLRPLHSRPPISAASVAQSGTVWHTAHCTAGQIAAHNFRALHEDLWTHCFTGGGGALCTLGAGIEKWLLGWPLYQISSARPNMSAWLSGDCLGRGYGGVR